MPKLFSSLYKKLPEVDRVFNPGLPIIGQSDFCTLVRETLLEEAEKVVPRNHNHRGFGVGVALLGYKSEEKPGSIARWGLFVASNIRLPGNVRKSGIRVCGEMAAMDVAHAEGYERIVALAVVGKPQPDHATHKRYPTLRPCVPCRRFMAEHRMPVLDAPLFMRTLDRQRSDTISIEELLNEQVPGKRKNRSLLG